MINHTLASAVVPVCATHGQHISGMLPGSRVLTGRAGHRLRPPPAFFRSRPVIHVSVNLLCSRTQGHPLGGDAGNLIMRHAGNVQVLQGGRQDGPIRAR